MSLFVGTLCAFLWLISQSVDASLQALPRAHLVRSNRPVDTRARWLLWWIQSTQAVRLAVALSGVVLGCGCVVALSTLWVLGAWPLALSEALIALGLSGVALVLARLIGATYPLACAAWGLVVLTPLLVVVWPAAYGVISLLAAARRWSRYRPPAHHRTLSHELLASPQLAKAPQNFMAPPGMAQPSKATSFVESDVDLVMPFATPEGVGRILSRAEGNRRLERGHELMARLSEFSDTVIREVMVPRTEVMAVPVHTEMSKVCELVLEHGHSRMPVFEETVDKIIGVLHVKDLFCAQLKADLAADVAVPKAGVSLPPVAIAKALRPVMFVPEVMKISALLREFQRRKMHMAIVIDEYGGTAGVVTLEDVIEEIVGEIQDEYDVEEKQFRQLGESSWLADARVNIWDLEAALGVALIADGDYETLAGFLIARVGAMPKRGEVINVPPLRFTVKDADARRINTVEIERITLVQPRQNAKNDER